MFAGTIGGFLLTPLFLFPSFSADSNFSAWFSTPRASAQAQQEWRGNFDDRDWGWWNWRNDRDERPEIDSLDPTSGSAGTDVTISGERFSEDSEVRFGRMMIDDVEVSDDGTELTFTVPDVDERKYTVRVHDDGERSNPVRFEVTEDNDGDNGNDDLSITGIDGPTGLSVDEEGTWTVNVEGTVEGNLRYSVKWGDEDNGLMRLLSADEEEFQSSATFTHTYAQEGTYTPEFTVTDEDGNTVTKASASVTVSDDSDDDDDRPHIDAIDPTEAEAGAAVTITGSGFDADSAVRLSGNAAADVEVVNDTTITFTVPTALGEGDYRVIVRDNDGRSNAIRLSVTDGEIDGRLSVSGISAPNRLEAGEEGTWTVHADSNLEGNLRYSVEWGDEGTMLRAMSAEATTQSSATFTHTYHDEGTYSPKFIVTDEQGNTAKVSASVVVAESDDNDE